MECGKYTVNDVSFKTSTLSVCLLRKIYSQRCTKLIRTEKYYVLFCFVVCVWFSLAGSKQNHEYCTTVRAWLALPNDIGDVFGFYYVLRSLLDRSPFPAKQKNPKKKKIGLISFNYS